MQTKNSISTVDGQFLDFNHPERYDFKIETIAHALSNLCRYGGHSRTFYSVAEHSVLVSRCVPADLALTALLHDASEAFCGDMPTPLKAMCQSYRTIEDRVQVAICDQYGLVYPFAPAIKLADKMVYKAEREQITTVDDQYWHTDIPAADVLVCGMKPEYAKRFFLHRYKELTSDGFRQAA